MKNNLSPIVKDTFKYSIGSVLQKFISLFLMPIYTRIFVPADYGVMNIVFTTSSLLGMMLSFGMDASFFRYYYEYDEKGKVILVSTIQIFRLSTSLLICSICAIFSRPISNVLLGNDKYYNLILLNIASTFFSVMWNLTIDILRVQFKAIWYNYIQVGGLLLQVSLSIIFVVYLRYGLFGIFLAQFISNVIVCSSALWITRQMHSLKFDFHVLKKQFTFGVSFLPAIFTNWITSSSDRLFLSRYAILSDVGIYGISNQIAIIVKFINSSFRKAWAPLAYRDFQNDDSPEKFKQIGLYYAIFVIFTVLGCSIFSSDLLHILTPESYHRSYLYVPILAYGFLFEGLNSIFGEGLNFANKPYYRSFTFVLGGLLNLGLNFYFIPKYGILGASITTLLAYFVIFISGYILSIKFYPKIKYDIRKIILISLYFVPFIIIGFFIDKEYSMINIVYKFGIYLFAISSVIIIFLRKETKYILGRYRKNL